MGLRKAMKLIFNAMAGYFLKLKKKMHCRRLQNLHLLKIRNSCTIRGAFFYDTEEESALTHIRDYFTSMVGRL